jgi:hypothetical protein
MAKWQGNRFVSGRSGVRSPLWATILLALEATPVLLIGFCFFSLTELVL